MCIMINDVKGEKMIDLSYPIHSKKDIAVVSMHISNSQILLHRSIEFFLKMGKKIVLNKGVYTDKELNSLIGTELKSQMLSSIEHGGTRTFFHMVDQYFGNDSLEPFESKFIGSTGLAIKYLWLSWSSLMRGYQEIYQCYG